MIVVIDTNVILVANGQHENVSHACVASCAKRLEQVKKDGRVAIDDAYSILTEYQNKTSSKVGKRAGDSFLKWLLNNKANPLRCDQVSLVEHAERGFESFPDDERLAKFDRSDRKFVAVAAAHRDKPPILQAADSKWLAWNEGLAAHGVKVEFLCPTDISGFEGNKKRRKGQGR